MPPSAGDKQRKNCHSSSSLTVSKSSSCPKKKPCWPETITLNAEDLNPCGYTIRKSGKYRLACDVTLIPPVQSTQVQIGGPGTGTAGYAAVSGGVVRGIFLVSGGSGYTTAPVVTIVGQGTGAQFTAEISDGAVTGFTQVSGGSSYENTIRAAITIRRATSAWISRDIGSIKSAASLPQTCPTTRRGSPALC